MSAATRAVVQLAVAAAPADTRARQREQWAADLDEASEVGMSAFWYSIGLVIAAVRLRMIRARRRAVVGALVTSVLTVTACSWLAHVATHQPECATPGATLGVVAGINTADISGPLPERAQIAMRAIRRSGKYEGVWVEPDGGVKIGVYGPNWSRAQAGAIAVATTPGPTITFVCQPATAHQLASAQQALIRSPLWQRQIIGFSDIDVKNATVTVAIMDSAPSDTEATLVRDYGTHLDITRSSHPFVEMGPGRGRMPLATDESAIADR